MIMVMAEVGNLFSIIKRAHLARSSVCVYFQAGELTLHPKYNSCNVNQ
jgi:hypothetical protein